MRVLPLLFLLLLCTSARAQTMEPLTLEARPGETLTYDHRLNDGAPFPSLDWAWSAQNACFVEPRAPFFTGNKVFFRTEIPTYSTMVIRLTPKDKRQNMSLLAYSGGHGALPPELYSCVSCEADFQQERQNISRPKNSHRRQVELRAVNRSYPITIAVVGANGLTEGDFTVEITVTKNR